MLFITEVIIAEWCDFESKAYVPTGVSDRKAFYLGIMCLDHSLLH